MEYASYYMKTTFFGFLILFLSSATCICSAEERIDVPANELEQMLAGKTNVLVEKKWPNGKIKDVYTCFRRPGTESDVPFGNRMPSEVDVFHGIRRIINEDGTLAELQNYYAGKKHGTQFIFSNGAPTSETTYSYGVKHG